MTPSRFAGLLVFAVLLAACGAPTAGPLLVTATAAVTPTRTASAVSFTFSPTASAFTATPEPSASPSATVPTPTATTTSALPSATPTTPAGTATRTPALPVPPASATPTNTPPTPTPAARLLVFNVSPEQINPGDPVTLEWAVQGDGAELCTLPPIGGSQPRTCQTVPVSGTLVLPSSLRDRYWARFSLRAFVTTDPQATFPYIEMGVAVRCPDQWLTAGPPSQAGEWNCPVGPAHTTAGAAQRFEHGGQYWLKTPDQILVYWDAGAQAFTRDLPTGQPDSDPTLVPPPGLYQPVRGFGLVWRGLTPLGDMRAALGWATEPEREYTFSYQCNAAPDVTAAVCLVLAPDGFTVWRGLDWGQFLWP